MYEKHPHSWFPNHVAFIRKLVDEWVDAAGGPQCLIPVRRETPEELALAHQKEPEEPRKKKLDAMLNDLQGSGMALFQSEERPANKDINKTIQAAIIDIAEFLGHIPALSNSENEEVRRLHENTIALLDELAATASENLGGKTPRPLRPFICDMQLQIQTLSDMIDGLAPYPYLLGNESMDDTVARFKEQLQISQNLIQSLQDRTPSGAALEEKRQTAERLTRRFESTFSPHVLEECLRQARKSPATAAAHWVDIIEQVAAIRDTLAEHMPPYLREDTLNRFRVQHMTGEKPNLRDTAFVSRVNGLAAMADDIAAQLPPGTLRNQWEKSARSFEVTARRMQGLTEELGTPNLKKLWGAVYSCWCLFDGHYNLLEKKPPATSTLHAMGARLDEVRLHLEQALNPDKGPRGR